MTTKQFESREKALEAAIKLYTSLTLKMHQKNGISFKLMLIDAGAWYIVRICYPREHLFKADEIRAFTEHERLHSMQLEETIIKIDYLFDIQNDKR